MKTMGSSDANRVLSDLESLVDAEAITVTDAWKVFKSPGLKHEFKKASLRLTPIEIEAVESLLAAVKSTLRTGARKRCAYCRRPMGTHKMSWHIEHIKPKSRFPELMFSMSNLVYACMDCNFTKNTEIDNPKVYLFDIIDPGGTGFSYSAHLSYLQVTTEHLHFLKYSPISPEGTKTYERLLLQRIEALEVVSGLNGHIRDLSHRIDDAVVECNDDDNDEIGLFLTKLKLKIVTR